MRRRWGPPQARVRETPSARRKHRPSNPPQTRVRDTPSAHRERRWSGPPQARHRDTPSARRERLGGGTPGRLPGGRAGRREPVQLRHPVTEFGAPCGGPFLVVVGPGEVEADGVGLLLGGRGGESAAQVCQPFGGVALFAEHDVEPVHEGVAAAGPGVVGGERAGVQGPELFRLPLGDLGAVFGGEVLEHRLHHVPGRHLSAVEAGLHAVGVALPEHRTPADALVEARQQSVQVARELPHPARELIHSHRSTPAQTGTLRFVENTSRVTAGLRQVFKAGPTALLTRS